MLLRCEFPLVDGEFLRVSVFVPVGLEVLVDFDVGLYLWMSSFDFPLYQLDAPDCCSAELDFPVRAAGDGLQGADVAVQGWRVADAAEVMEHLGDAIVCLLETVIRKRYGEDVPANIVILSIS